MIFHVPPTPVPARGIDDTVDVQHVPGNLFRSGELKHSGAKFSIDQIVIVELAGGLFYAVAFQQVLDDFRFTDIGNRDDFDIVAFQCEVIKVPADLPQAHNANSYFPITHLQKSALSENGIIVYRRI